VHKFKVGTRRQFVRGKTGNSLPGRIQVAEVTVKARNAEQIGRELEERVALLFHAPALDELTDLVAYSGQDAEQAVIARADVGAEEFQNSQHI
jgi:hypothetical protein